MEQVNINLEAVKASVTRKVNSTTVSWVFTPLNIKKKYPSRIMPCIYYDKYNSKELPERILSTITSLLKLDLSRISYPNNLFEILIFDKFIDKHPYKRKINLWDAEGRSLTPIYTFANDELLEDTLNYYFIGKPKDYLWYDPEIVTNQD